MNDTETARLSALASAGAFIEQRISRGQSANGEREASDALMGQIAELLTASPEPLKPKPAAKK